MLVLVTPAECERGVKKYTTPPCPQRRRPVRSFFVRLRCASRIAYSRAQKPNTLNRRAFQIASTALWRLDTLEFFFRVAAIAGRPRADSRVPRSPYSLSLYRHV
jgi:hypothetical protein